MINNFPFSELQVRRFIFFLSLVIFIIINWGSTFEGLKHVALTGRTYMLETLTKDVQIGLTVTLIPFGKSAAHFMGIGLLWLILDWVVRKFDLDKKSIESEIIYLRKENAYLRKDMKSMNVECSKLLDVIDSLIAQRADIEKYCDQTAQLNLELDKLAHKKEQAKKELIKDKGTDSPDLFDVARLKPKSKTKKRRPPRRPKPKPKF